MKNLLVTLVKAVVLLVGAALAAYGLYALYKKYIAKQQEPEFIDTLDYDSEFGYDTAAHEEDKIAQTIRSAREKITNVIGV